MASEEEEGMTLSDLGYFIAGAFAVLLFKALIEELFVRTEEE